MATTDKNKAVVDYLLQFSYIANSPLFFNFSDAKDGNKQIATISKDNITDKKFIDGSVEKQYNFMLFDYKSAAHNPIVKLPNYDNENVTDMLDVESIINWINAQESMCNYPNFGTHCEVQKIEALSNTPNLNGIDTANYNPPLAKYGITIRITYIDKSNKIWS